MEEEKSSSAIDRRNVEVKNISPSYIKRVGNLILAEQKNFANWYMEKKLGVPPRQFEPSPINPNPPNGP